MDSVLLEMEDHVTDFYQVKELVLSRLLNDKTITDEQFDEYNEKWNVIIIKPNWFKKWKSKFYKDSDEYIMKYVKFES